MIETLSILADLIIITACVLALAKFILGFILYAYTRATAETGKVSDPADWPTIQRACPHCLLMNEMDRMLKPCSYCEGGVITEKRPVDWVAEHFEDVTVVPRAPKENITRIYRG